MREHEFDVGYRLLDDDLIDSNGRRCGKVDDLEIEGEPGGEAHLSAILTGPGAWERRLPRPFRPAVSKLFGSGIVRVPWSAVNDIEATVTLKGTAEDLGLGKADVQPWIEKLPGG